LRFFAIVCLRKAGANSPAGQKAEDDSNIEIGICQICSRRILHHGISRFMPAFRYRPSDRVLALLHTF
jgi:hypothetical protein